MIYLQDGDVVTISGGAGSIMANGKPVKRPVSTVDWSAGEAERGKYPHYMLKEINEQPERVEEVLRRTLRPGQGTVVFEESDVEP